MLISELVARLYRPIRSAIRKLSPSERRFERRVAAYDAACRQSAIDAHQADRQLSSSDTQNHEGQDEAPQSDLNSLGLDGEDVLAFRASEVLRYSEFLSDEENSERHGWTLDEIAALKAQAMQGRAA